VAGQLVPAEVVATDGVDLVARVLVPALGPAGR
jgi:ribosomal protein S12 methylthiotransferase